MSFSLLKKHVVPKTWNDSCFSMHFILFCRELKKKEIRCELKNEKEATKINVYVGETQTGNENIYVETGKRVCWLNWFPRNRYTFPLVRSPHVYHTAKWDYVVRLFLLLLTQTQSHRSTMYTVRLLDRERSRYRAISVRSWQRFFFAMTHPTRGVVVQIIHKTQWMPLLWPYLSKYPTKMETVNKLRTSSQSLILDAFCFVSNFSICSSFQEFYGIVVKWTLIYAQLFFTLCRFC